jgi:hypothetical protein
MMASGDTETASDVGAAGNAGAAGLFTLLNGLRDPESVVPFLETTGFRRALLESFAIALGGSTLFGAWTGLYSMTFVQFLASAIKAPLLLLGTTVVCFPTFFMVQYVVAPRALSLRAATLLQASTVAVIGATWSVVALPCSLFLANSENYSAAKWLVALVAGFGGLLGMLWFGRGFRNATSSATRRGGFALLLPYCVLYGLVGAQLAWSLRPFLGSPSAGFTLFRPMGGNLFESLF